MSSVTIISCEMVPLTEQRNSFVLFWLKRGSHESQGRSMSQPKANATNIPRGEGKNFVLLYKTELGQTLLPDSILTSKVKVKFQVQKGLRMLEHETLKHFQIFMQWNHLIKVRRIFWCCYFVKPSNRTIYFHILFIILLLCMCVGKIPIQRVMI